MANTYDRMRPPPRTSAQLAADVAAANVGAPQPYAAGAQRVADADLDPVTLEVAVDLLDTYLRLRRTHGAGTLGAAVAKGAALVVVAAADRYGAGGAHDALNAGGPSADLATRVLSALADAGVDTNEVM